LHDRTAVESIVGIIVQLLAGAVGGQAAGAAIKSHSLGTSGNCIAGAIGGLILTQVLGALGIGVPDAATLDPATAGGALDMSALIAQVVGGGAGGAMLTIVAGVVRGVIQK
jgi:hypothetical protein